MSGSTQAVARGLAVLGASVVLGALLWFVADTVGSPTPTAMRPGVDQPAIVGLEHTVTYLAVGTVIWLAWAAFARLAGIGRRRRPR